MAISPESWKAVKGLFEAALAKDSAQRSSFLRERCGDASVRAEVERLLSEYDQAGGFLSTPLLDFAKGTSRKRHFSTGFDVSSVDSKRERFAAQCASLQGAEALFVEYPRVSHVRVTRIEYDSWSVRIEFADSFTPGMYRLPRNPCRVAAAWIVFSFSTLDWQAQRVGWRFLFDPALIRDCARIAAMANQNGATIAFPDYFALFSEWQKSRIIPLSHAPNQPRLIPQTSPEPVKRRLVAVPLRQIGPYGVVGEVGRGGMGVVYKATDPARDRTVAIKMIQGQAAANSQGRMGLVREARAAGSLRHTNIIEVYDIGQHKGWLYIVMEYLHGAPLHKIISRGNTLQLAQKLRIIIDVCDALDYAHSRGIVHRDVKPGNIFLTRDYVAKVVDFGLAVQDDAPKQKGVAGTIPYIAPEILGGAKPDSASDVWAAAVTMYELVSGKLPFSGPNLLHQIVHSPLPLLDFSLPYASELNCVLGRALSKNKNDRYPTAISFATELRGLLTALE